MNVQAIVSDVRGRVVNVRQQSQDAFAAYIDTQTKAFNVVTRNSQTLANTEIGAAKNVFAAARASFEKARADGMRQVAQKPQAYVPNGRDQIVSAYKDTIDLLVKTGKELSDVLSGGYKKVLDKLTAKPAKAKKTAAKRTSAKKTTAKKTAAPAKKTTAAKRKTAATRKTTAKSTTAKKTNSATAS